MRSSSLSQQRVTPREHLGTVLLDQVSKTQKSDTVWRLQNKRYKKPKIPFYYTVVGSCLITVVVTVVGRSVRRQSFDAVLFAAAVVSYIIFYIHRRLLRLGVSHPPRWAVACEWKTIKTHDNYDCCYIVTCRGHYIIHTIMMIYKTVVWRHFIIVLQYNNAIKYVLTLDSDKSITIFLLFLLLLFWSRASSMASSRTMRRPVVPRRIVWSGREVWRDFPWRESRPAEWSYKSVFFIFIKTYLWRKKF